MSTPIQIRATSRVLRRPLKCFDFYLDKIKEEILNEEDPINRISSLITYLNDLLFTPVTVTDDAEAFDVFESLNAKGSLLTAADLLKNRFIMYYRNDIDKQREVSNNWDILSETLEDEESRFDIVEFIWFYWNGFHQSGTPKKALYRKIREHLREVEPLSFLKDLQNSAIDFASWTASTREFPIRGSSDADTALGEINLLRYRSCYPAFLLIKKTRPGLFDKFVTHSIDFLFRVITISRRRVGEAEKAFRDAIEKVNKERTDSEIIDALKERDVEDAHFINGLKDTEFKENRIARYIWAKCYYFHGSDEFMIRLDNCTVEHILPQKPKQFWSDFEVEDSSGNIITMSDNETEWSYHIEKWIYNIGNMALLTQSINGTVQNKAFKDRLIMDSGELS